MFLHLFYYRLKKILRTKEELFWCIIFPILLGTMFYLAFSNITNSTENFNIIPVAYVEEEGCQSSYFNQLLDSLSNEGENQLLTVNKTSIKKAEKLLKDGKVDGIIINQTATDSAQSKLSLSVKENGINQSILKSVLDQYLQKEASLQTIGKEHPEALPQALMSLATQRNFLKETQFTSGTTDLMTWYFFALLAMNCMYGCFSGVSGAVALKAKASILGARRSISPTHYLKIILADFSATVIVQFLSSILCLAYLIFILDINFGNKYGLISLTCLVGCIIGVSIGWLIGSITRLRLNTKLGIATSVSMISCFLSGLMVVNMKDIVSQYAPIVNRINPATLLCEAFYSLNIYNTYERFTVNIISLLLMAAILCFGSYLAIRKDTM